ncbi:hypothetical protein SAMN05192568_103254 [Methylobacterium pseudosasicola]|uniref:Zinc-ribbon domain-containing protein n=1 Tax=Methylobacterium pseudosasicola TaxID=582667 RepID=A0A1I4R174_9HYPH|nr:hypothetical protein SAMN05192568_103254 [Methylobacterium pseudosasicola]
MLYSTCRTCGRHINQSARICAHCGALTGVTMRSKERPAVGFSSFIAATVVGLVALVIAKWTGLLP